MSVSLKSKVQRLKLKASCTALAARSGDRAMLRHEKRCRASLAAAVQKVADISRH